MNNRGWGLREELLICFVLIAFFGIAIIFIHKVDNYLRESNNENIMDKNSTRDNIDDGDTKRQDSGRIVTIQKDESNITYDKYKNLENDLVEAAVIYQNKYYNDIMQGDTSVVTVVRLQTDNILNSFEVDGIKCSGYVEIETNTINEYHPYMKCGSLYETKGYDVNKDNTDL